MSKKKKSIMDGYFDEPAAPVEINPFVEEMIESQPHQSTGPNEKDSLESLRRVSRENQKNEDSPSDFLGQRVASAPTINTNLETKWRQSGDKVEPKLSQSEAKVEPKLSQTRAKVEPQPEPLHKPMLSQSEAKVEPMLSQKKPVQIKVEPQPEPLHKPMLSQSEAKVEPNGSFESLVGLQRAALIFLFDSCLSFGSKISGPISISNLATNIRSTVAAARKAVQRLEQKGYIVRAEFKDGRGGWTRYSLPQGIYSDLLSNKTRAKVEPMLSQTRAKVEPQPEPQPEPWHPSSSSKYLIKDNTNTEDNLVIPENLKTFGFNKRNLSNLAQSVGLSSEEIQSSLDHFDWDVQAGVVKRNHLNLLMGVLRKKNVYISSGLSQQVEKELHEHLTRIANFEEQQKQLVQIQQENKFRSFLESNPNFLEEVKKGMGGNLSLSDEMIKKMAFAQWTEQNPLG